MLLEFTNVFQEPSSLPPCRVGHDHKIPLMQGANPVNKRPCRYAKQQKDIINGLIQDYLKSGIIQKSDSPYASPVVLVGKKDGPGGFVWIIGISIRQLSRTNSLYH